MILDTLHSILRAGTQTLAQCGSKGDLRPTVRQILGGDLAFSHAAEVTFAEPVLRRLILACDGTFAQDYPELGRSPAPIFGESLPAILAGALGWPTQQVADWQWRQLAGTFAAGHRRCYRFDFKTGYGTVTLLAELATHLQVQGRRDPHALLALVEEFNLKEQLSLPVVDRTHQIKRYLDFVRRSEMDIQVELPDACGGGIRDATYLKQGAEQDRALVCLSMGGLETDMLRNLAGQRLNLFFGILGRLFQFHAEVVPYPALDLGGGCELPVVALSYPRVISAGQRRNAFRIKPSRPMTVEIGTLLPDPSSDRPVALASSEARVANVSFTGLKAMAPIDALLDVLDQGDEIFCRVHLPARFGTAELIGILRRAAKLRTGRWGLQHDLGVEFVRGDPRNAAGLEQIRQYVLAEQRRALRERAHAFSPAV